MDDFGSDTSSMCVQLLASSPFMFGKATQGGNRMELLHDMMEGRDYRQLKDLILDRSRWREYSKNLQVRMHVDDQLVSFSALTL